MALFLNGEDRILHILDTYFKVKPIQEKRLKYVQSIKNFEVRDSDIFLIGYPKTGTTWLQEMVWLINNPLDADGAKTFIDKRVPFFEACTYDLQRCNPEIETFFYHTNSLAFINNLQNPRFIKSHLIRNQLPEQILNGTKKPKIIYIARNPKDACLSAYYYFRDILKLYSGNLDDFCSVFMSGKGGLMKPYWEHVLCYWERRNESNVLFIKYEDMKHDLAAIIRKVASFLDQSLTDKQMATLLKMLSLEYMKNNTAVNRELMYKQSGFIRSGKIGGYKEEMSPKIIEKFDEWIREYSGTSSRLYL